MRHALKPNVFSLNFWVQLTVHNAVKQQHLTLPRWKQNWYDKKLSIYFGLFHWSVHFHRKSRAWLSICILASSRMQPWLSYGILHKTFRSSFFSNGWLSIRQRYVQPSAVIRWLSWTQGFIMEHFYLLPVGCFHAVLYFIHKRSCISVIIMWHFIYIIRFFSIRDENFAWLLPFFQK